MSNYPLPNYEVGDYVVMTDRYANWKKPDGTVYLVKSLDKGITGSGYKVIVEPVVFSGHDICSSWFVLHKKGKLDKFKEQLRNLLGL